LRSVAKCAQIFPFFGAMQIKDMVNDFFEFKKGDIANQAFVAVALGFDWFLGQISFFVEGVFFKGQ
jgi:hypothetical protein